SEDFEVLHFIARRRLAAGKMTVIDATNVQKEARKPLVELAREFHCLPCAIVFDLPRSVCHERNKTRPDRDFGRHVIQQQISQMKRNMRSLKYEGFRHIYRLNSEEQVNESFITRTPLWNDKTDEKGPFDIIGDIHGCCDELEELLQKLGYEVKGQSEGVLGGPIYSHPEGRKAVFVGDLVDRGPRNLDAMKLAYNMVSTENALCVPGNHDMKFMRKLQGKDVQITHGLAETLAEVDAIPEETKAEFTEAAKKFLYSLVSHYLLDGGKLVVSHAGLKQEMQGRGSGKVRDFCLYGETTGETDEFGLPVRYNWAAEYRGPAMVVYGHTPVVEPEWLNRTVNIDTGCVFGGKLTALRYPEKEFVEVSSKKIYCEPKKPMDFDDKDKPVLTQQQHLDDLLDAEDVIGKRIVLTRLRSNVTIREENAIAALEVMSRFAINPKWLIYLPPTMSPSETSQKDGYLEYPTEAFSYFRKLGIPKVICEEKHMGSRAVIVICKDVDTSTKRFGVVEKKLGVIYTRTGRSFFNNDELEQQFLERLKGSMDKANFWEEFETDWACFDCELMPWSEKAKELLKTQYAAVGSSATASLAESVKLLKKTVKRGGITTKKSSRSESSFDTDINLLMDRFANRQGLIKQYISAYQQYCWPVQSIDDYKLAPFHLLATEKQVHVDKNHEWHMNTLAKICEKDKKVLLATPFKIVDVTDKASEDEAIQWWIQHTNKGGEGMVIKPLDFVAKGKRGLVQPALKCRGKEYLRIIYGPEYSTDENLERLRNRGLGTKRSLAMREFAIGIEGLERFVRKEPLRRVHECTFGVLALESEPVDPRL
ncbi:MAG: polynucleotide kinase-phosphatase, partial [Candidatus Omnitrophica bacterium]|nr:polynucleotide kinase-phosphatase [Candidatus Omnitrophota bacterium]